MGIIGKGAGVSDDTDCRLRRLLRRRRPQGVGKDDGGADTKMINTPKISKSESAARAARAARYAEKFDTPKTMTTKSTTPPVESDAPLTKDEQGDYIRLKTLIKSGIDNFKRIGEAILEVHDRKLYRDEYGSFEDFCEKEYGVSRKQGYRLMDVAKVSQNVSSGTQITQKQAEQLAQLPADQQQPAMDEATATATQEGKENPTTANVAQAVAKRRTPDLSDVHASAVKVIGRVYSADTIQYIRKSLTEKEMIFLGGIEETEMKRIEPYLLAGWKVKAAIGYQSVALTYGHTIRMLCDRAIEHGKFVLEIDDWIIEVRKKA